MLPLYSALYIAISTLVSAWFAHADSGINRTISLTLFVFVSILFIPAIGPALSAGTLSFAGFLFVLFGGPILGFVVGSIIRANEGKSIV